MRVVGSELELRGISNKTNSQGKVFYLLNVEESDGTAHQFYCPNVCFQSGLKKGDIVNVVFELRYYDGQYRPIVIDVNK